MQHLGGSGKTRSHCWALGGKENEMERKVDLVCGYPGNVTAQVTRPGGSSSAPGRPLADTDYHLQWAEPSVLLSLCPQGRSRKHTCGCVLQTSSQSHSLLCVAERVGGQGKHKLVSREFSPPRQPPPASCRDGPIQPPLLQLEMEGSRWPCLAQIPARLPGRCGQSEGAGVGSGDTQEGGGSPLFAIAWGLAYMGGGGEVDCGLTVVLESADAQSPPEREGLCILSPG